MRSLVRNLLTLRRDLTDRRVAAGALGGLMYVVSGAIVLGTLPFLPEDVSRPSLAAVGVMALLTGSVLPFLPWRRWPSWTPAILVVVAQANIAIAGQVAPGSVQHYLPLYVLSYLYLGMTLAPGAAFVAVPLSAATIAVAGNSSVVHVVITLAVAVTASEVLSRLLARQDAVATGLARLLEASKALSATSSVDAAAAVIGALTAGLATADHAAVMVVDPERRSHFVARMTSDALGRLGPIEVDIHGEPTGVAVAIRRRQLVTVPDTAASLIVSKRLVEASGIGSAAFVPLFDGDTPVGAIFVGWDRSGEQVDGFRASVLELLSVQAGPILARHLEREHLNAAVERDPLTEVANRRVLDDAVDSALPGDAFVMLDIDRFKRVNDERGHAAGDAVLRDLAECLRGVARGTDIVGRYGGEEFLMVLPLAGRAGVDGYLGRLRHEWSRTNPFITFSTGSAVVTHGESPTSALGRADAALYEAKASGRNRDIDAASATS